MLLTVGTEAGNIVSWGKRCAEVILWFFPRSKKRGNTSGQSFGLFDTVVERDALIGIAGEKKAGVLSGLLLDIPHPFQVPHEILRNRPIPTNDRSEDGLGRDFHGDLKFGSDCLSQAFVIPAHDVW